MGEEGRCEECGERGCVGKTWRGVFDERDYVLF